MVARLLQLRRHILQQVHERIPVTHIWAWRRVAAHALSFFAEGFLAVFGPEAVDVERQGHHVQQVVEARAVLGGVIRFTHRMVARLLQLRRQILQQVHERIPVTHIWA